MRVVITNSVALNGGDAAILLGEMKLLRAAFGEDTRFAVVDNQPDVAKRHYPELDFHPLWHVQATQRARRPLRGLRRTLHLARIRWAAASRRRGWRFEEALLPGARERRALEAYATADLVVSTGGTYLVEHYPLRPRLFEFDLAHALGKPLILFTQSLGPFQQAGNRRAVARALSDAALVLVRDEASRRHLLELDLPPQRIRLAPDAAFALETPSASPRPIGGALRVAISVREWAHFRDRERGEGMRRFGAAVAALARHLIERHGAEVTFLSTCQGIAEYRYDDSRIAAEIVGALPDRVRSRTVVNRDFHRPEKLIELLQAFDMAVATRMHLAILSLVAGTPVLPIAYEFKTTELFTRLGFGTWVQHIETVTSDPLIRGADAFIADLPALRAATVRAAAEERARARAIPELLQQAWQRPC